MINNNDKISSEFVYPEVSIAALQNQKDKKKFDAINSVLSRTNYEEYMQHFIESSEQIIYLYFSEDVIRDMPKCNDSEIHKAVHNIFPVKTWLFDNGLIVGYGKKKSPNGYPFMKIRRLFLIIGFLSIILFVIFCLCISFMMIGGSDAFCNHHSTFCSSVLIVALMSGLQSAVGWIICNIFMIGNGYMYIDRKSVAVLPIIRYKDII